MKSHRGVTVGTRVLASTSVSFALTTECLFFPQSLTTARGVGRESRTTCRRARHTQPSFERGVPLSGEENAEKTASDNGFDCVSHPGLGQRNFRIVVLPTAQHGLRRRTRNCRDRSSSTVTFSRAPLRGQVQEGRRRTDRSVDSWEGRFGTRRDARDTDLLHPSGEDP